MIDLASPSAGGTGTARLVDRYDALAEWAKNIEDVHLLRKLTVARTAVETARTAARILSRAKAKKSPKGKP